MSKYQAKEITDKRKWEQFLLSHKPGTFLQSWNWGETNKLCGFKVYRLGFYKDQTLIGVAQLIHQPAKRGPHFLIPGGPVIDFQDRNIMTFAFKQIRNYTKQKGAWFVRIRPDIVDTQEIRDSLKKEGLTRAPMHLHGENTLILDISQSEEEILQKMRKTTRYLIRRSLNEGYTFRISKDTRDTQILATLQTETVKRHHFIGFSQKLFEAQLSTFAKDNQAELVICQKDKKPLVAALVIYYADKSFYHHSGSAEAARTSNASYFTQWQIIKRAKEKGLKYYDFWGIAPTDDPKHRFAGVTVFKKGFGGERTDWLHAHDLPANPLYWTTFIFETGRRILRRL